MTYKYVQKILDKKAIHKKRNYVVRVLAVLAGVIVGVIGIPFVILFPELGIPLLIISLAILSLEFEWAGHLLEWISIKFDKILYWLRRQSLPFHIFLWLTFIFIAIMIIYIAKN